MKTIHYLYGLIGLTSLLACERNDPDRQDVLAFEAPMSNTLVVGHSSGSAATALFSGLYTKSTRAFSYSVTYNGLTPTGVLVGIGAPGANGPTDNTYLFPGRGNPLTGSVMLTLEQENNLIFGTNYVLLTSSRYPDGEIRGNIRLRR